MGFQLVPNIWKKVKLPKCIHPNISIWNNLKNRKWGPSGKGTHFLISQILMGLTHCAVVRWCSIWLNFRVHMVKKDVGGSLWPKFPVSWQSVRRCSLCWKLCSSTFLKILKLISAISTNGDKKLCTSPPCIFFSINRANHLGTIVIFLSSSFECSYRSGSSFISN